ncbi:MULTISPECIES: LysR substrate-binding domain-containing protein [Thioclava]|uniref:LysR substrate-binding domain-containing protein n=1 Tax=Thioclava kandeliae TaxID=3070818 RepID=A0ABV1SEP0_9RHOB
MRKRIPLNAIRAFEATARNSSVVKAADELCVTPTAVSHQIRQLEEFLQVRLFIRKNSRIELTTEARANVHRIGRGLDLINDAILALEASDYDERRRLTVSASTSVATFWLIPILSEFTRQSEEVDVTIKTFLTRKEAEEQESDLRIVNWLSQLDCHSEPLLEEEIIPVCSPELAARFGNDSRTILQSAPLAHVDRATGGMDGTYPDWARYLADFGISRKGVAHGSRFNQAGTAMEAASAGLGVILGRSLLIADALEKGRLVPVADPYHIRSPYYLNASWKQMESEPLVQFRTWITEKVRSKELARVA